MRSYRINTDRMVNQLVPHYLGGRKLILFLQAILQPLNSLNVKWKEWADEKRIEAAMTSQVIMMEYFLNHKFRKYFLDTSEHIVISDGAINGVPIYWEDANKNICELPLYNEGETEVSHPIPSYYLSTYHLYRCRHRHYRYTPARRHLQRHKGQSSDPSLQHIPAL